MGWSVFEFSDYRSYLTEALPIRGEGRGGRGQLAQFLGVQKGFISAVLHGDSDFSLEQALRTSKFLSHGASEEDFFLLLVQYTRAGSRDLQAHFRAKIDDVLRSRREIRERIATKAELSEKDQLTYYSTWHYTAIHMCLMVSKLRSLEAMAAYLGLPLRTVSQVMDFFLEVGIAKQTGQTFVAEPTRIHLPSDSLYVLKHHSNWRMQAVQALDRSKPTDLHYSLVMSISEDAAEKIRKILLDAIQQVEPVMKEAKDEAVFALSLDLFDMQSGK